MVAILLTATERLHPFVGADYCAADTIFVRQSPFNAQKASPVQSNKINNR